MSKRPEKADSRDSGVRPSTMSSDAMWRMEEHREGKHAGRYRTEGCPHCFPPTNLNDLSAATGLSYQDLVNMLDSVPTETEKDFVNQWPFNAASASPEEEVPRPETAEEREKELRHLWRQLSDREADRVIPKAVEYGAADLDVMGHALGLLLPNTAGWTKEGREEAACAFYALGKIARVFGAYAQGKLPSDDCWHDLGVYARMVQIIRWRGRWM